MVEDHCNSFYIRAVRSAGMDQQIGKLADHDWKQARLGSQNMEVPELTGYRPFGEDNAYRLVVSRIKRSDSQADLFSGGAYTWRAILTNDTTSSPEQIVAFYNKRGNSEQLFDIMSASWRIGWSRLPCSFLSENTAFIILSAIVANFYRYLIGQYSKTLCWLKPTYRLKKFIFRFITVPAKWIKTGRRYVLKLYTHKDYAPLLL